MSAVDDRLKSDSGLLDATDDAIEREALRIVAGLVAELGGPAAGRRVAVDDSLDRDLGIGSLERVELLLRLEQAFGVRLDDTVIAEAATPRDLASAIRAAGPERAEASPVVAPPPGSAAPAPASARTLVDVLAWHADRTPDRIHIHLRGDDGPEEPITYGALRERASSVAADLRDCGVAPGDSVALMLRTEAAFFDTFFGVLMAGAVPVPIYPPVRRDRIEEYARRQVGILDNARARLLITFPEAERVATFLRSQVASLHDGRARAGRDGAGAAQTPRAEDPALIQYTSGSTGAPKGVLLTHGNLLANIRSVGHALGVGPDDAAVSWLPLYHDMGLIGSWLGSLYFGIPVTILSPLAFLSRPARWLRALSAHRATISAAPNFAYDLCAQKASDAELEGVDLRAWRLAMNGSEAVSPETMERFARRFASFGFRREAMCPVYGLAEASVALTVTRPGAGPRIDAIARDTFGRHGRAEPAGASDPAALRFVGSGRALPGHDVRIVDDSGTPVGERRQGRIQFRGPSVTAGYFRNPDATSAAFSDGWMDSGDLGYRAESDLFVTGRRKDIIIKGGRNLYPQEVEEVVGVIEGVRRGCVAAFGVRDQAIGTERLVVVAETRERDPARRSALEALIAERVVSALGVPADAVTLAEPGAVPKTSSGKIRRSATREAYLDGALARGRPSIGAQWARLLTAHVSARVAQALRRAGALAIGLYLGALLLITMPPLWLMVVLAPSGRAADRVVRLWCRVILSLSGSRLRTEGREHLPAAGPAVLVANHASYADVVALLAAVPADFRFVAKRELRRAPLVGSIIRRVGHLTVERAAGSQSVADALGITRALSDGRSLLVFPEGTFARPPGILPFRLGAFKAAVDTGTPVVPIAIAGTRDLLPAGHLLPTPGPVTVRVSAPIAPEGSGWPAIVSLRDRARIEIARLAGEPLVDARP